MLKGSTTVIPYDDIDYEIRNLIKLINNVNGIETTSCCCGHGKAPCQIMFKADNAESLSRFWHKYLYRNPNWHIVYAMNDTDVCNEEWDKPNYLLETTFPDFYYTGLAIDNLTYRLKEKRDE